MTACLSHGGGERVWCNPPYGRVIRQWVEKAYHEWLNGATVVLLVPARTDTAWFHDYILPYAEVRFLRGRVHFNNSKDPAPFPSMVCIFKGNT